MKRFFVLILTFFIFNASNADILKIKDNFFSSIESFLDGNFDDTDFSIKSTEGLKPQEDSGPGGPTSASSGLRSRGGTSHGPPKTAGADSIESVSSTSSNYDGGDNAALYNKGQKSSKSARKSATSKMSAKSATSKMSAGGQIPVSETTPPTKLSTKICVGITLLLGLTVIIILVWLIKSKFSRHKYLM